MYPVTYTWPKQDLAAICLEQTTVAPGFLALNGILGNQRFPKFSRTVAITSTADLSALNFTVTGNYQGQPLIEIRTGPDAGTTETLHFFDQVTSISVDGVVADVQVGTGQTGHTHWFVTNLTPFVNFNSVQVIIDDDMINYSFVCTNQEVTKTTEFNDLFVQNDVIGNMQNATTTQFGFNGGAPFLYGAIQVNGSDGNGTFRATILQMGDGHG